MQDTTPDFAAHVYDSGSRTTTTTTSADSGEGGVTTVVALPPPRPFRTPDTLHEFVVTCTSETKPLLLSMLLRTIQQQERKILIFTGTVKNTHRLCRLLQILEVLETNPSAAAAALAKKKESSTMSKELKSNSDSDSDSEDEDEDAMDIHCHTRSLLPHMSHTSILEYSSHVPAKQRASHLKRFARNNNTTKDSTSNCRVLVCSDAGARGLDIDQVTDVINYDTTTEAKTYVHRVGRTARAGRKGKIHILECWYV